MKRSYQSVHPVCNERSAAGKKERTRGPRFTGRKRKAILSLDCRTLEHIYLQWYLCSLEPISFVHYVVCIFISSVHCTFCCVYINFISSVLLKLLYIGISSAYVVKIIFVVHLLCVATPSVYTRILFFCGSSQYLYSRWLVSDSMVYVHLCLVSYGIYAIFSI